MPAPTKVEERPTRYIAQRTGPVVVKQDGQRVIDAQDVTSVGGENGHSHQVEEVNEGGKVLRFITCEECARNLGWPAEGVAFVPGLIVSESRAMDQ